MDGQTLLNKENFKLNLTLLLILCLSTSDGAETQLPRHLRLGGAVDVTQQPRKQDGAIKDWKFEAGALEAGGDMHTGKYTFEGAIGYCASQPTCVGFTFLANDTKPTTPVGMYFKDVYHMIPGDSGWSTYVKDAPYAALYVNASHVSHEINPLYMGCHSDSGYTHQPQGFYSQMIYGESFGDTLGKWNTVMDAGAQGTVQLDSSQPFNGNKGSQLIAFHSGSGRVGVTNRGLGNEGLALEAGREYEGYILARASAPTEVHVTLEDHTTAATLARQAIAVDGDAWTKYDFAFTTSAGTTCAGIDPSAGPAHGVECGLVGPPGSAGTGHVCVACAGQLAIALAAPNSSVHVGFALLQPGAWGRFQGLPVLDPTVRALQAMGVTAIRQGGTFACEPDNGAYYAWEKWTGPPYARPSMGATWKDSLIGGWGPFEMIDLCNAAGWEPIMTTSASPTPEEFADLVEYCWGNASTPWGHKRIHRDLHPRPYAVRYFELGNEQYNADYLPQVAAMEARAAELGMANEIFYLFPDNVGLNATDIARAKAMGVPIEQLLVDIHTGGDGGVGEAEALFAKAPEFEQGAVNCETNASNHTMARALMEAADLDAFLSSYHPRLKVRAASFCTERSGHFDAFDQGLAFFLPNMTWLQPPGFVHQMITQAWQPLAVAATVTGRFDQSSSAAVSRDGKTLVIRYTNKHNASIPVKLEVEGFPLPATGSLVRLSAASLAAGNTPGAPTAVSPEKSTIHITDTLSIPGYSFSTITLHSESSEAPAEIPIIRAVEAEVDGHAVAS